MCAINLEINVFLSSRSPLICSDWYKRGVSGKLKFSLVRPFAQATSNSIEIEYLLHTAQWADCAV